MPSIHESVLLQESVEGLEVPMGGVVVDATFGGGGHSLEILKRYPNTKVLAIDQDASAWERVKDKFADFQDRIIFYNGNFREMQRIVGESVDAVLFDLGLSSDELLNSGRGFTFMQDEPLLMTMKANPSLEDLTARDIVNTWAEDSIEKILRGYGEERFAKRIAKGITTARVKSEINSTLQLVEIIKNSVPAGYRRGKIHPATKTFQALRIAVNDELGALNQGLVDAFGLVKAGGRVVVISFHSLEDRIVKNFFKGRAKEGNGILINKKVITPSQSEIKRNPKSRSAKLRIIEKIKNASGQK